MVRLTGRGGDPVADRRHFADRFMGFSTFSKTFGGVSLLTALQCVQHDVDQLRGTGTSSRILLCVRGLQQCGDEDDCTELLTEMGVCMDEMGRQRNDGQGMVVVVYTRNRDFVLPVQTVSGRPIVWIPLPALDFDEAVAAFANRVAKTAKTAATPNDLSAKHWLRSLVAMSSGHPGSLSRLACATIDLSKNGGNLDAQGAQFVIDLAFDREFLGYYHRPFPKKDTLRVLEAIVSGRAMRLDEKLGEYSVKQLIDQGVLINSDGDLSSMNNEVVPTMSMLRLSRYPFASDAVPDHVSKRLNQFIRMFGVHETRGEPFELLDARFRALQRAVMHAGRPDTHVPMAAMAEHGIIRNPRCSWWEEVEVGFAKAVEVTTRGSTQLSFDFGNLVTVDTHEPVTQRPGLAILPPASNNSGCDFVFVDEEHNKHGDDGTGNVVTMLEYSHSSSDSVSAGRSDIENMLTGKLDALTKNGTCPRCGGWGGGGCVILTRNAMWFRSKANRIVG